MMVTLSVIKADIGSLPGHVRAPRKLISRVEGVLEDGKSDGVLVDYYVGCCGDDIDLVMSHDHGVDSEEVHSLAWSAFQEGTELAKEMGLYGAGQDLLSDAFSGNVKGLGPGSAEIEFSERESEPVIVFMCDKTSPSAFNLPLFKMFGDPFSTSGLVLDPSLHEGFTFEVLDYYEGSTAKLSCPEEMYDLLSLLGISSKYSIEKVYKKSGEPAAAVSTEKLNLMAGEYVGKDDPVALVRCQSGYPAVGEALEAFTFPHLVPGWMRGSHNGPLMPVSEADAAPTRFDGPPRVVALGFQLNDGKLEGPRDMFDDPSFDNAREKACDAADYMRGHGPFQPHLLSEDELEYTTLPKVLEKLEDRFE
ncbi:fructose-1,6-bisphosphate aldolase/phosphatase [Methanonatronarchaeum sp. AMET6-2]|uniref:fructose-1,6-bisphosphate aldolase/phosphatase n=1 Tax=Methanonatronarchaeum sp. AMET6-2 TaxID=2933293 RepID=UPI001221C0FC|nr:fructose-1,6-bisphosphate aldolase/phosphatase [Methanonatronarchaeum sp. AMET6-2]RZN61267.1 MAG: fructose 1,6-bisphosphatase [Methanonatronarchaeia archaeon]UOY10248.1 fructose-1,6-bisphosphatase [Methanonatronarchaeum sp. AMET6-2]